MGLDLLQSSGVSPCAIYRTGGQQQHLRQPLQALGVQEMQWAQALDKGPWLQMYTVSGNCTFFGSRLEESPSQTWHAGGGSFLLLPRRHALSSQWLWTLNHKMCKNCMHRWSLELLPVLSSSHFSFKTRGRMYSSCVRSALLHASETWPLTKPNLQHLQWNDRAMIRQTDLQTLSPSGPMSYLRGLALRIWTSFWRREGSAGMDVESSNGAVKACDIQVDRKPGPGRPKMTWKQLTERDCREWKLSAINPHDRYTWRSGVPWVQQASYLEGGPLMWMLPLYLHVNQNSNDDDDIPGERCSKF